MPNCKAGWNTYSLLSERVGPVSQGSFSELRYRDLSREAASCAESVACEKEPVARRGSSQRWPWALVRRLIHASAQTFACRKPVAGWWPGLIANASPISLFFMPSRCSLYPVGSSSQGPIACHRWLASWEHERLERGRIPTIPSWNEVGQSSSKTQAFRRASIR